MEDCWIGDLSNIEALDCLNGKSGLGYEATTKLVNFTVTNSFLEDVSSSLQADGDLDGLLLFPVGEV